MKLLKTVLCLAVGIFGLLSCEQQESQVKLIVHVRKVVMESDEFHLSATATSMPVLSASVLPEDATDKRLRWASSHPDIVSVNEETGALTRTSKSISQETKVTITATSESGVYGKAYLYLGEGEFAVVTGVLVTSPDTDEDGFTDVFINGGKMPTFVATLLPDNKESTEVLWSTSDPGILTINSEGQVALGPDVNQLTKPAVVAVIATAGNGVSGSLPVTVGVDKYSEFTFEGEDENFVQVLSFTAGRIERQPQGACKNDMHLMWWNMQSQKDESHPAVEDPVGNEIVCNMINIMQKGTYTVSMFLLNAIDFGTFDFYMNDVKFATEVVTSNTQLVSLEYVFPGVALKRGNNTFKAVAVKKSELPGAPANAAMLGLDQITLKKQ